MMREPLETVSLADIAVIITFSTYVENKPDKV